MSPNKTKKLELACVHVVVVVAVVVAVVFSSTVGKREAIQSRKTTRSFQG